MASKHPHSSAALDLEGLSLGDGPLDAASNATLKSGGDTTATTREQEAQRVNGQEQEQVQRELDDLNEKEPYTTLAGVRQDETSASFDRKASPDEGADDLGEEEIQTIMDQFGEDQGTDIPSPTTSPQRELPVFHYPPRSSSLDLGIQTVLAAGPMNSDQGTQDSDRASLRSYAPSIRSQPPPPEPDPEPDLPFDFHRFLEQLRHRTADPVAKFLRSFLQEFAKKQWQAHEQVKIIGDFLVFIAHKMANCDVWRTVSDAEFENAKEGMEKLVMNRLYSQTFSPEIPAAEPTTPSRRTRRSAAQPLGPGRRGQHQEDIERDEVLAQKIRIYGWISEEHLDIKPCNEKGKRFLVLAQQELAKIKGYRAPRDKVICVLNTCKVIMGYLRNSDSDQSADSFIPLLIYTVLKAKPDHLVSNVQYIQRFRSPEKLSGEAGYYMSSLIGAVQFIENLDRSNLTVSEEEFDRNVEAAVSEIAEREAQEEKRQSAKQTRSSGASTSAKARDTLSEKPLPDRPSTGQNSSTDPEKRPLGATDGPNESSDPVGGLLRTIQKPLSSIGRIFSDDGSTPTLNNNTRSHGGSLDTDRSSIGILPSQSQRSGFMHRHKTPQTSVEEHPLPPTQQQPPQQVYVQETGTDFRSQDQGAALQASAEADEAYRIMRAEHSTVVDTLSGMFPDLDVDLISDVVRMQGENVGLAVDACLALSR